jgi:hypothetical protein
LEFGKNTRGHSPGAVALEQLDIKDTEEKKRMPVVDPSKLLCTQQVKALVIFSEPFLYLDIGL